MAGCACCRLQAGITQMSVSQLANILQDSQKVSEVQLIDVREEVEARVSSLPRFQLKPLSRSEPACNYDVTTQVCLIGTSNYIRLLQSAVC